MNMNKVDQDESISKILLAQNLSVIDLISEVSDILDFAFSVFGSMQLSANIKS